MENKARAFLALKGLSPSDGVLQLFCSLVAEDSGRLEKWKAMFVEDGRDLIPLAWEFREASFNQSTEDR